MEFKKIITTLAITCTLFSVGVYAEKKAIAIAGSTREDSFNKKLVKVAADIAREQGVTVTVVDLKDYPAPLFDEDLEKSHGMPASIRSLRKLMLESDIVILSSPEYNGSISAVMKNTLDWLTRDEKGNPSREAFKGKKFILLSASPSPAGGNRGIQHLKDIVSSPGGEVVDTLITLPNAHNAFNGQGKLKDPEVYNKIRTDVNEALKD
jgi:chromate reductase